MQQESIPSFTITEMTVDMFDESTDMRLESWLDTYVNESIDVTRQWIETRNAKQQSPEKRQLRHERFISGLGKRISKGWVALDGDGKIIGSTAPYVDEDGKQHVGSLYVDKRWHGKGVAGQLMQKVVDWFDASKHIELEVVDYNERAKAFYRKWGFEVVSGSESLFDGKIPEVKMVKAGNNQAGEGVYSDS